MATWTDTWGILEASDEWAEHSNTIDLPTIPRPATRLQASVSADPGLVHFRKTQHMKNANDLPDSSQLSGTAGANQTVGLRIVGQTQFLAVTQADGSGNFDFDYRFWAPRSDYEFVLYDSNGRECCFPLTAVTEHQWNISSDRYATLVT